MSGTYRHGRVYCQMADCRNRTTRTVKLELPASWSVAHEYRVRTVLVGVCGDCARDLDSRARALTGARAEFGRLLTTVDETASREAELSAALRRAVELIGSRLDLRRSPVYANLRAASTGRSPHGDAAGWTDPAACPVPTKEARPLEAVAQGYEKVVADPPQPSAARRRAPPGHRLPALRRDC